MRAARFAVLSLAVTLVACAPPASQEGPELAAVDKAWAAAFNEGDVTKIAALYAEDARLLAPNAQMSQGKPAVEAAFKEMIAAGFKGALDSTETIVAGDIGYGLGTYEIKSSDGTVVDRGKYMETFRKVGAEWKISNDIWNSDLPAGPAGTPLIIAAQVKDSARWLAAWQGEGSRAKMFAEHGAPSVKIFASPDHPNHHALLVDVADMAAFQAWSNSDDAKAAKAQDGVLEESLVMFTPVK